MATNFPTSLDNLTNPTSSSGLNSPDHAGQHTDANDAIEALQAKVGVNSSAVTTSLDYKVTNGVMSALNVDSGTLYVDATNNRVGVNNQSPTTALDVVGTVTARAASTQDGVALAGRAGGTGTYEVTLTPTTLTADRTLTLPDATGTVALVGDRGLTYITYVSATSGSTMNLDSCFTSTYTSYRLVGSIIGTTTTAYTLGIRFKVGAGTPTATGYYTGMSRVDIFAGTASIVAGNNATYFDCGAIAANAGRATFVIDIINPQTAQYTSFTAQSTDSRGVGAYAGIVAAGQLTNTTQYDGLQFGYGIWGTGTISNLEVTVYGYK